MMSQLKALIALILKQYFPPAISLRSKNEFSENNIIIRISIYQNVKKYNTWNIIYCLVFIFMIFDKFLISKMAEDNLCKIYFFYRKCHLWSLCYLPNRICMMKFIF